MSEHQQQSGHSAGGLSMLGAEIVVAFVLFVIGSVVVYDSHRLGSSWGADGPGAGYFPFYIGLFMGLSSAVTLLQALFGKRRKQHGVFVEWQPLRQVLAVLLPALVYVLGIQLIGLYVASAIYIAGFMIWLGKYSWMKSIALAVAVSAAVFVTFEVWFQVPLFKGAFNPLAFLGY
jgi:hypothetical protein